MGSKTTVTEEFGSASREQAPRTHSLVGPLVLIALGVVFLVGQFVPAWRIGKTWPALLIVIGTAKLVEIFYPKRHGPSHKPANLSSRGGKSL
jgi:LiaI-LiaF-like transmembrane region